MASSSSGRQPKSSNRVNELPRSLPLLLARRPIGRCHYRDFLNGVARHLSPQGLVLSPQIVTPQTQGNAIGSSARNTAINSIHVDRVENRFLLAGDNDAIVSIYDLSKWGSEEYLERGRNKTDKSSYAASTIHHHQNKRKSQHKPIASSQREPPRSLFITDPATGMQHANIQLPTGHASPISKVQWYPVDSGAFLSSSKDGCLLVWDTDSMTPVSQCIPFAETKSGIGTFHLSPLRNYSAIVASLQDPSLKLVDIRSGASSHTLLGHNHPGVSSVQWAPQNDVILASGGLDGTVRLWDIRKAGSRACLAILDLDRTHPPTRTRPYKADYSHLPRPSAGVAAPVDFAGGLGVPEKNKRKRTKNSLPSVSIGIAQPEVAPNNYRMTENSTASSHIGAVTALSFLEEDGGHHLVSASQDGNLHIWDLRANGHLLPLRFLAPGQQPAVPKNRNQVPMLLTAFGRNDTSSLSSPGTCWVGNGSKVLGFSLDHGGVPQKALQGHLHTITAIDMIEAKMQLLTAARDGMILTWGKPEQGVGLHRKRKVDQDSW